MLTVSQSLGKHTEAQERAEAEGQWCVGRVRTGWTGCNTTGSVADPGVAREATERPAVSTVLGTTDLALEASSLRYCTQPLLCPPRRLPLVTQNYAFSHTKRALY